jgi:hypothetical protein
MESHDDERDILLHGSRNRSNAESGISEALADALSSSLACIAATGKIERARAKAELSRLNGSEDGFTASSLSGSDAQEGGAPVVTATSTTTTSSGDDRDSSAAGNGSGGAANKQSSSLDDRDSSEGGKARPLTIPTTRTMELHDHQQRQRKTPSTESTAAADHYGLPISLNDRVHAQNALTHATVFAHLPPPSADSMSCSGSGSEVERIEGDKKTTGSLQEIYGEPGFYTIRRTFNTLVQRESTTKSETMRSSSDHSSTHKRMSARKRAPIPALSSKEVKAKKRHAHGAWTSDNEDDVIGSGNSSGSGTEDGYAGSASSYDSAPSQGSCSSPSESSSDEISPKRRKSSAHLSGDPTRPMLSNKHDSFVHFV